MRLTSKSNKGILTFLLAVMLVGATALFFTACEGPMGPVGTQGEQGPPGNDGIDGEDGEDGKDGKNSYIVIFEGNGGRPRYNFVSVLHGDTITAPTAFSKTGYECKLGGWYKEAALTNEWDFAAETVTANITLYAKWVAYEPGDTGPGGGTIYYRSETGFDLLTGTTPGDTTSKVTAYYLEAAPEDTAEGLFWGITPLQLIPGITNFTDINDPEAAKIGNGRRNTAMILLEDPAAPAAKACNEYANNDKTDWFLPSLGELMAYYDNFSGDTDTPFYWSSSQSAESYAWYVNFNDGSPNNTWTKTNALNVRPVRAF